MRVNTKQTEESSTVPLTSLEAKVSLYLPEISSAILEIPCDALLIYLFWTTVYQRRTRTVASCCIHLHKSFRDNSEWSFDFWKCLQFYEMTDMSCRESFTSFHPIAKLCTCLRDQEIETVLRCFGHLNTPVCEWMKIISKPEPWLYKSLCGIVVCCGIALCCYQYRTASNCPLG